jgi:hypothetical protein
MKKGLRRFIIWEILRHNNKVRNLDLMKKGLRRCIVYFYFGSHFYVRNLDLLKKGLRLSGKINRYRDLPVRNLDLMKKGLRRPARLREEGIGKREE